MAAQAARTDNLHVSHVHRGGGAKERPDNTLETFKWCWENGSAVECDCRKTKDGVGIMLHDRTLWRTGRGIPESLSTNDVSKCLTWDQIKDVDVGSYLGSEFAHHRIPTIEATFAAMRGHPTYLAMVDEKGAGPDYIAKKAIEAGVQDQVYYTGQSYPNIVKWNETLPGGKALLWIGGWPKNRSAEERARVRAHFEKIMDELRRNDFKYVTAVSLHTYYDATDPVDPFVIGTDYLRSLIDEFHRHGVVVCSIPFAGGDREECYFRLFELGCDGFSTDYPSVMFSVIRKLKAAEGRHGAALSYSQAATNCVLDLSVPEGEGFATLVWLHGGGLTAGHRQHLPGFDTNRFASVAVEYRLVPQGTFTNCVEDAAAAVAWTLDHIAEYGGDPRKVFVGGHSAGGWLTYMVGYDPRWLKAHGHSNDELAGLIPLSGQATTHFNVRAFRGDGEPRYAPKIDEWAPLAYVCGGLPPTCIVTGQRGLDIRGRVEENELMAASLRACGTRMVEFHELEGCGHGTCMKGLAPIAHAFMRKALQPTFRNSLGAPNGEAPSFAYDPVRRCHYGVFSGERDLTVWRARHAADILSARDFKVVAKGGDGVAFRTPKLMRLADGRWRVYASAPTVAVAESKTADLFDGFGPFSKLDWNAVDSCVFTAADGRTYMAAVELPAKRLAIREMASPTAFAGRPVALAEGLEGPAFLVAPNGRVFLAATENGMRADNACVRLLAFGGGALADAKSWTKLDAPLVVGGNGVWGPGFASFFTSPDGRETWCAFHAMGAPAEGRQPAKLYARIQKVDFGADGVPSIGVAAGDRQELFCPSGE